MPPRVTDFLPFPACPAARSRWTAAEEKVVDNNDDLESEDDNDSEPPPDAPVEELDADADASPPPQQLQRSFGPGGAGAAPRGRAAASGTGKDASRGAQPLGKEVHGRAGDDTDGSPGSDRLEGCGGASPSGSPPGETPAKGSGPGSDGGGIDHRDDPGTWQGVQRGKEDGASGDRRDELAAGGELARLVARGARAMGSSSQQISASAGARRGSLGGGGPAAKETGAKAAKAASGETAAPGSRRDKRRPSVARVSKALFLASGEYRRSRATRCALARGTSPCHRSRFPRVSCGNPLPLPCSRSPGSWWLNRTASFTPTLATAPDVMGESDGDAQGSLVVSKEAVTPAGRMSIGGGCLGASPTERVPRGGGGIRAPGVEIWRMPTVRCDTATSCRRSVPLTCPDPIPCLPPRPPPPGGFVDQKLVYSEDPSPPAASGISRSGNPDIQTQQTIFYRD